MLLKLLRESGSRRGLLANGGYRPPFRAEDRAVWDGVDEETRRYWIQRGERYLHYDWPPLTSEMYAEYQRTGRRGGFELPYHTRRQVMSTLVLAEGFENRGRFLPSLAEGLSLICKEPTWVLPAHRDSLRDAAPDEPIDIFAAETGNALAWVLYVFQNALPAAAPEVVQRVRSEVRRRIIEPYLSRTDFWWMGFDGGDVNNWTTWCTSNCLGTILLEEPDPDRRLQGVKKACDSLSRFLERQGDDGGCDEGPMYWNFAGACLFDCLEMLYEGSGGAFDLFDLPLIQNIATYICKVHVDELFFVNFADSPPEVPVDAALMYRFGKRIGDRRMQALGAHLYRLMEGYDPEKTIRLKMYRALAALPDDAALRSFAGDLTHPEDVYLERIQVMVARQYGLPGRGLVLAAKGGHNDEGHNHNDVGNVVVYMNGQPVLIDVGMAEYSRKSFSHERYDMWTVQSAYHNVPLPNDAMQRHGPTFCSRRVSWLPDGRRASLKLDVAAAYPDDAGLALWERECILDRDLGEIRILEDFGFRRKVNDFELRFMTCRPSRVEGCDVWLELGEGSAMILRTAPAATSVSIHRLPVEDRQLRHAWGDLLYQIRLRFEDVGQRGRCTTFIRPVLSSGPTIRSEEA
jgi:hypothetical protein